MAAAIAHAYHYAARSQLERTGPTPHLRLATSGGEAPHPFFFEGALTEPKRAATAMLTLARVARSRFHIPPAMLARILRAADPVVTSSADRLRMESFSACCGAYARVDMLPAALDGELRGRGTTNVDFNPPMRAELAKVTAREKLRLSVGERELRARRGGGPEVVEKKVPLPLRWLKGFVAVQSIQARMELRLEAVGTEARRFLRAVPRESPRGPLWVTRAGRGLRIAGRAGRGAVQVGGIARLHVLDDLAGAATRLRVYADEAGHSAWELCAAEAHFHLVLTSETWRGFSGEGAALTELATDKWRERVPHMRAALAWRSRIAAGEIAAAAGVDPDDAAAALAVLGSRGLVGYDLAEQAYFHRELPFDMEMVDAIHPRLANARKLVDSGGVESLVVDDDGRVEARVRGSGVLHTVRIDAADAHCTCPWFSKHRGERGPCKHVLALQLALEAD